MTRTIPSTPDVEPSFFASLCGSWSTALKYPLTWVGGTSVSLWYSSSARSPITCIRMRCSTSSSESSYRWLRAFSPTWESTAKCATPRWYSDVSSADRRRKYAQRVSVRHDARNAAFSGKTFAWLMRCFGSLWFSYWCGCRWPFWFCSERARIFLMFGTHLSRKKTPQNLTRNNFDQFFSQNKGSRDTSDVGMNEETPRGSMNWLFEIWNFLKSFLVFKAMKMTFDHTEFP